MTDHTTDAPHAGREAGEDVKRSAERLAGDARATAEDLGDRARDQAWSQAERARTGVATEISGVADALRKAAQDMRSGSPQERTFGQIAEGLADASETIRDRDVGQLASDVSRFARSNPLVFLGGAALAGFAATRFAKASASTPRDTGDHRAFPGGSATGTLPAHAPETRPGPTPTAPTGPGATPSASTGPNPVAPVPATPKTPGDY